MYERELRIYAFLLGYEQKLLADLRTRRCVHRRPPG
jgi:hypothetical protein